MYVYVLQRHALQRLIILLVYEQSRVDMSVLAPHIII